MNLSQEEMDLLNSVLPTMKFRNDKVTYKGTAIPSKLYPLNNKKDMCVFYCDNTKPFTVEAPLGDIFNSVNMEVGRCYTNCYNILLECHKEAINYVIPYVGWVSVAGGDMVHHCWLVVDGVHIIDGSADTYTYSFLKKNREKKFTEEEIRAKMVDMYFEYKDKPNTERFTFGQVNPTHIYVGCPCDPLKGIDIYNAMMKQFPNHPSYRNIRPDGSNKLQRMIFEREKNKACNVLR